MGLITGLLGLPLAPLRGTIAAAEQILHQAEDEFYDPATIRAQLEEVDRQREAGLLTEEEALHWEDELVERLMVARSRPRRDQT
jgi:cytochrome c-type biogenesis protein CcmH/NrfG